MECAAHIDAHNGSEKERIAYRRDVIGRGRLQGLTLRELAAEISDLGLGPSDRRHCLMLVYKDLKFLEAQWRANASRATEQLKARQLAELEEVKRWSWEHQEVSLVLKALTLEVAMTGTKSPDKAEVKGSTDIKVIYENRPVIQDLFDGN
jgi:hypothetical protein